jgi:high-affinity iron transporter
MPTPKPLRALRPARLAWLAAGLALLALIVWQATTASGGTPNPTDPGTNLSHGAVVLDSGLLVMREGLETVLVLAAVTASLRGGDGAHRKPVALGAAAALAATVATWFVAIAITSAVGEGSLNLQAATGLLAVLVLLVVMNWFFHKVYWTGWISHHNRRRRSLMAGQGAANGLGPGPTRAARKLMLGLALLGFTSVYREGFEVVLFLQSLRLRYGSTMVLEGVAIGLACTAVIGYVTFVAHSKLPYKRMLVVTGVLLGIVLLVMVGESVQELQQAGWIGTTPLGIPVPGWLGLWLSIFPNVETLAAQALAAAFVIGSYVLAEEIRVKRPRRRGRQPAVHAEAPPPRSLHEPPAKPGPAPARAAARPLRPAAPPRPEIP